jgi:peptide/nickel transport system ATP-binding protein
MGVIFISHDLGVVSEIADRIAVMYRGNIVEEGPTAQIIQNPQHPYTKALLACRPILHTKGERSPVVDDFLGTPQDKRPAVHNEPVLNETSKRHTKRCWL